jgi:hypothetical protein
LSSVNNNLPPSPPMNGMQRSCPGSDGNIPPATSRSKDKHDH